jgi:hypothetical protein
MYPNTNKMAKEHYSVKNGTEQNNMNRSAGTASTPPSGFILTLFSTCFHNSLDLMRVQYDFARSNWRGSDETAFNLCRR